jgi:dipeptidyl-peptidase-3
MWDQNYRYNLKIRKALEHIYQNYKGDKSTEDWENFSLFKRVWFSNGIHHHYSNEKSSLIFSESYFSFLMKETETELAPSITAILFNEIDSKKVNLDVSKGLLLAGSAINFMTKGLL